MALDATGPRSATRRLAAESVDLALDRVMHSGRWLAIGGPDTASAEAQATFVGAVIDALARAKNTGARACVVFPAARGVSATEVLLEGGRIPLVVSPRPKATLPAGPCAVLMTAAALLQEVDTDATLSQYGCVVLAETPKRSVEGSLLVGTLKKLGQKRTDLPVVILGPEADAKAFGTEHKAPFIAARVKDLEAALKEPLRAAGTPAAKPTFTPSKMVVQAARPQAAKRNATPLVPGAGTGSAPGTDGASAVAASAAPSPTTEPSAS